MQASPQGQDEGQRCRGQESWAWTKHDESRPLQIMSRPGRENHLKAATRAKQVAKRVSQQEAEERRGVKSLGGAELTERIRSNKERRLEAEMVTSLVMATVAPLAEAGGFPSRHMQRFVPPHTLQASIALPLKGTPSQPWQEWSRLEGSVVHTPQISRFRLPPSHTPQRSGTLPESLTPSQPTQEAPSPPQMPQASKTLPEKGIPSQPRHVVLLPPHMPHLSGSTGRNRWSQPQQMVQLSTGHSLVILHEVPSPPQTPHTSYCFPPPGEWAQSHLQILEGRSVL